MQIAKNINNIGNERTNKQDKTLTLILNRINRETMAYFGKKYRCFINRYFYATIYMKLLGHFVGNYTNQCA